MYYFYTFAWSSKIIQELRITSVLFSLLQLMNQYDLQILQPYLDYWLFCFIKNVVSIFFLNFHFVLQPYCFVRYCHTFISITFYTFKYSHLVSFRIYLTIYFCCAWIKTTTNAKWIGGKFYTKPCILFTNKPILPF